MRGVSEIDSICQIATVYIRNEDENMVMARIKKLLEFDNVDFWLVSGNIVHKEFDQRWRNISNQGEFIGGHHYAFEFIPENEIWISDLDKDTDCTMIHEYVERLLMMENHLSYEKLIELRLQQRVYIKA